MAQKEQLLSVMKKQASLAGFQTISTPALEYAEVLLGLGGETDKQVFKFTDNGGREVALRFDLTVPFARFVSEHFGNFYFPLKKRMQCGDVWRAEKPQKGRYREFAQFDLDIIGVDSLEADCETVVTFATILAHILKSPFTVHLGNRYIVSSILKGFFFRRYFERKRARDTYCS